MTKNKHIHEILDPIHGFIHLSSEEREVVDSRPFQRLRHIHQLGLSSLVYPGATHRRFEHSLGVMELASQVFDVITHGHNLSDDIRDTFGELHDKEHWRKTLRMAALCHDMGHMPFSHATEKFLPSGTDHEDLTYDIISHNDLKSLWKDLGIYGEDIAKLAIGPEKLKHQTFTPWETILAEIIVGDFFGVDRMDYLLRDSYHLGVTYGQFEHNRVIQSLRLLAIPPKDGDYSFLPTLGIEEDGLGATEGMSLARYFMYSQVYMHPVCRIYEIHLHDFMKDYLKNGQYSFDLETILSLTDNEINAALADAAFNQEKSGHQSAHIIASRGHYRLVHEHDDTLDQKHKEGSIESILKDIVDRFEAQNCKRDRYSSRTPPNPFFIRKRNEEMVSAYDYSQIFKRPPIVKFDRLYVAPAIVKKVGKFLGQRKHS